MAKTSPRSKHPWVLLTSLATMGALWLYGTLTSPAHAEVTVIPAAPIMQAYGAPELPEITAEVSTKVVNLDEAQRITAGDEKSLWKVFAVNAGKCEKKNAKNCKQLQRECQIADKFAQKHGIHATCSALYTHTSVHLAQKGLLP